MKFRLFSLFKKRKKNVVIAQKTEKKQEEAEERPKIDIRKHFDPKPKRCYIIFYDESNEPILTRLIPPYYEFLPGDMVKLYLKVITGSGKLETVLPLAVFENKPLRSNMVYEVLTYDIFGNSVERERITLSPVQVKLFAKLVKEFADLQFAYHSLSEKYKEVLKSNFHEQFIEVAETFKKLSEPFGIAKGRFSYEEKYKKTGEEYE